MINPNSVCAVVVTYNRLEFLKEGIQGILDQTTPPDKIIIVNNGSTDGTDAYLKTLHQPQIEIVTQENLGGAGGFHTGIKKAYEAGYEWIWVMDDDVEPFKDCLENLLKYKELSQCIHPLRIFSDNNEVFKWEHYFDYRICMPVLHHNISLENKDFCYVNTACFEGMLIHRDLVEKIGFPNKEYFIAGDDTEYGILANLHTNVMYTKTAAMYRKRANISYKIRPLQAYYEYRNIFLLRKNIRPYFPENFSSMFYKNLYRDFFSKVMMIIKGKEYPFSEKKLLISKMWKGIKDGKKIYKNK
ncbi:Glycosyltransferase, GT2 family [Chryseobacterium ureilyticum]|uniref:Glycosyltransferase, GT2 family n=1 Tax=Chryseobacterium ureilyticum TaxID=373668 RepID=A0A1N7MJK5_9FLAO|nr:glycosyltransferase family 2 protein [Chryseobacterium ureilyticum]SIS86354.1 Glycosyltransferase, GT2 family [Chryseobacterium ureilyticum]